MKQRADGRFTQRVTLPTGEKMDVYGKTKKEVQAKVDELKLKFASGTRDAKNKATVEQWARIWYESEKKGKVSRSTEVGYSNTLNNYILPAIGGVRVIDIRHMHCQAILNDMPDKSQRLQKMVKTTLSGLFRYAVINGLISFDPSAYITMTAEKSAKKEALDPEQVEELLGVVEGTKAELMTHLALYCGLRRGEVIALQWSDITGDTLTVSHSADISENQPIVKNPKSEAGRRTIPIPLQLKVMLEATPKKSMFVVPMDNGDMLTQTAFRRRWEPIQKALPFPCGFHQLRHTYATSLHHGGVDAKTLQALMGHAKVDLSLDTYVSSRKDLTQAKEQINNIFPIKKNSVKSQS
ncbi:MAG: site-specific integrase [Treponema sp.]|jgi:integrase|nr:site-specific integrase [Treponema sp.]